MKKTQTGRDTMVIDIIWCRDVRSFGWMSDDVVVEDLVTRLNAASPVLGYKTVEMEEEEIEHVLDKVKSVLMEKPMLLEIKAPTYVFGDIHGQYYDLLQVFNVCGEPSRTNQMLFLGDYVDRGRFGLETAILLFCYKIQLPDHFHILRGNHESRSVSRVYGFYEECSKRFNASVWKQFMEVFDCLPIACIISKAIMCMHGGISPHLHSLNDIRKLPRPADVPPGGLMADLLWSDPDKKLKKGWSENPRGVSFIFAKDVVESFLRRFNLDMIIRAHQVVHHGYEMFADGKLITVFTAPNFCGQFENMGGIIFVGKKLRITMTFIDGRMEKKAKDNKKSQKTHELSKSNYEDDRNTRSKDRDTDNDESGRSTERDNPKKKKRKSKKEKKSSTREGDGESPSKHGGSPSKHGGSPGKRGGSPGKHGGSPGKHGGSPNKHGHSISPKKGSKREKKHRKEKSGHKHENSNTIHKDEEEDLKSKEAPAPAYDTSSFYNLLSWVTKR